MNREAWEGRDSGGKPFDLGERCLVFGRRMLDVCEMLPDTPEGRRIRGQIGGAGPSVGANYEEGDPEGDFDVSDRRSDRCG